MGREHCNQRRWYCRGAFGGLGARGVLDTMEDTTLIDLVRG